MISVRGGGWAIENASCRKDGDLRVWESRRDYRIVQCIAKSYKINYVLGTFLLSE